MAEPVQAVGNVNVSNASSVVLTFGSSVTAGHTIAVCMAGQPGGTHQINSVTDSKGNTTYTLVDEQTLTTQGNAASIYSLEAIGTGGASFAVTVNLPAGTYGLVTAYELAATTRDRHGHTGDAGSTATTATITFGGVNTGTADFACCAMAINGGANPSALSNPPTGWNARGSELNGTIAVIAQASDRTDASALTDSAVYAWVADGAQGWAGVGASWYTPASGALSGTAAMSFGQSGALTGAGALAGSSALTFGQSATLKGSGALAATSALTFGQSATLTGSGALAATAALSFGQSGTLSGVGALAGTSALVFGQSATLTGTGALAGESDIVFGGTGTLTPPAGALAGTSAMTFGATGTLTGTGALSGQSDIVFDARGTLIPPYVPDTGAGSAKRRRRYFVHIDGVDFPVEDAEDARQILAKAKDLAESAAEEQIDRVPRGTITKVKPIPVKPPKIAVSPELGLDIREIKSEIAAIYRQKALDRELLLLLAREQLLSDDDDEAFLLLQ